MISPPSDKETRAQVYRQLHPTSPGCHLLTQDVRVDQMSLEAEQLGLQCPGEMQ